MPNLADIAAAVTAVFGSEAGVTVTDPALLPMLQGGRARWVAFRMAQQAGTNKERGLELGQRLASAGFPLAALMGLHGPGHDIFALSPLDTSMAVAINAEAGFSPPPAKSAPSAKPTQAPNSAANVAEARRRRAAVDARIAAQPRPYLRDTLGGLEVELEALDDERQMVAVLPEASGFSVSRYDTMESGRPRLADARVERLHLADWAEVVDYLSAHGAVLTAMATGVSAKVRAGDGGVLTMEGPDGATAELRFRPERGRDGALHLRLKTGGGGDPRETSFLDWIDAEATLEAAGFAIRAVSAPAPGPRL